MNRGNLAEDPKAGLSSSSRYSRMGGEKNSLLYVDSSSLRKEKKAAERKKGKNGTVKGNHNSNRRTSVGRGISDSHMDRLEVGSDGRLFQVKESTSSSASDNSASSSNNASSRYSRYSRTEKAEASPEQTPKTEKQNTEHVRKIRPAIASKVFSRTIKTESAKENSKREESQEAVPAKSISELPSATGSSVQPIASENTEKPTATASSERAKPVREYLSSDVRNPLLGAVSTAVVPSAAASIKVSAAGFFRRYRLPIIAAVVSVAAVGYGYTAWHYRNRFYPGTEFFGISAEEQSIYDVKAAVKAKVDSYSLELIARKPGDTSDSLSDAESSNVIEAEDVNMIYRDNGEIDQAMKDQRSWAWPVMMIANMVNGDRTTLETSYDENLVPEALGQLDCMNKASMIKPQDAQIIMTDDGALVQPEIYGTTLDEEKTEEAVKKALSDGSVKIDLDREGLYVNPKVYCSDLSLATEAMAMNKVLGAKVTMPFGDRTEVINSEVIETFLKKDGSSYVLDEEKVRDYVADLARKYDTYQCERELYTSIGTKVTLEAGIGDYGWQLDQEATYAELLEAIRGQKKTTIDPIYTQEAYCRDANDIGDTYVEVSLTNQTMWFYKNGKLVVETPVVTGNPYAGHETPSGGVWSLKGRMRNQLLSGEGYSSPVDYWMPFNNGVGIHDLQSRAWFGGTIYMGSGSHGCVNTPLSAVKLIYDQIEAGVPVIVYKDESEKAMSLITDPVDAQTLKTQIEETYGTIEDDGAGSIVAWTSAQKAAAAAAAAAANTSTNGAAGTTGTGGTAVTSAS